MVVSYRLVGLLVGVAMVVGVLLYPKPLATPPVINNITIVKKEVKVVSIDKDQLRELIKDVLISIDLHSDSAEELLMLTTATESHLGKYLTQNDGDDDDEDGGVGIFQMEKATEQDIWDNYLDYREELSNKVLNTIGGGGLSEFELRANLTYQIVLARIHYLRVKEALPESDDIGGLARYWKIYYNSKLGKGTIEKAIESYNYYVADVVAKKV